MLRGGRGGLAANPAAPLRGVKIRAFAHERRPVSRRWPATGDATVFGQPASRSVGGPNIMVRKGKERWEASSLPCLFPRPLGAFEERSAAHIIHELANILVSGGTLGADLRGSPGKLLAYLRFDRGCLSASQLLQKCPVYPLVCRIAYNSHRTEHCRRSYFAALLVSTVALRASIRRRGKR
jgi:hypothetical protein